MRFYAVTGSAARHRTECAIVGLYESGTLSAAAAQVDTALGGRIARLVKRRDARGKLGECTLLDVDHGPCARVLLVGLGKKESFGRKQYKKSLLAAAAAVARTGANDAVSFISTEPVDATDSYYRGRLAAESVGSALYRVPAIRSSRQPAAPALKQFGVALADKVEFHRWLQWVLDEQLGQAQAAPAANDLEVLRIRYFFQSRECPIKRSVVVCDTLGSPPLAVACVVDRESVEPQRESGVMQIGCTPLVTLKTAARIDPSATSPPSEPSSSPRRSSPMPRTAKTSASAVIRAAIGIAAPPMPFG